MTSKSMLKAALAIKFLLPAIAAVLALVLFFLPTVCFTVDGVRSDATSASELLAKMENEIDKSEGVKLDGVSTLFLEDVKVSVAAFYIFAFLSVALSFYLAVLSLRALSLPPKSNGANRAKVWLGFVFPKFFIAPLCALLPLGVTLFPHFIYSHYVTWFGYDNEFAIDGAAYIATAAVILLFAVDVLLFALTRRGECEHQLDMWQKYSK